MRIIPAKEDFMAKELLHTIELKKQLSEDSPVDDWIRLFNATDDEEFAMIKRRTPGMLEAMEVVRQMSLRKRIKWEFEQRQVECLWKRLLKSQA